MEQPTAEQLPIRSVYRRIIGRIGGRAIRSAHRLDQARQQEVSYGYPYADAYVLLALSRYKDFIDTLQSADFASRVLPESICKQKEAAAARIETSGGVKRGFLVCGYLLGYSVRAYHEYVSRTHRQASLEELQALLTKPETIQNILLKLAYMDNEQNKLWEESLDLMESAYVPNSEFGYTPLLVVDADTGPVLTINPAIAYQAEALTAGFTNPNNDQCPGAHFIPQLWKSMVHEFATHPQTFVSPQSH